MKNETILQGDPFGFPDPPLVLYTLVRMPYNVSDSPFFMILSDFAPVCSSFATAKAIDRLFPPLLRSWFSLNLSATATDHINLDHMVHFLSR